MPATDAPPAPPDQFFGPGVAVDIPKIPRELKKLWQDSAGVATLTDWGDLAIAKTVGRIDRLEERIESEALSGTLGIGHTRWATHGPPTEVNAHPHVGGNEEVIVAHNGVIENYQHLKERLEAEGYVFRSATDTEVIAHLIAKQLRKQDAYPVNGDPHAPLLAAVKAALAKLRGSYGLVILFPKNPDVIIAARLGSQHWGHARSRDGATNDDVPQIS